LFEIQYLKYLTKTIKTIKTIKRLTLFHKHFTLLLLTIYCAGIASGYTVQSGDTLMAIAKNELGDASRWREIIEMNQIPEPYTIAPGNTLILPDIKKENEIVLPDNIKALTETLTKLDTKSLGKALGEFDFAALKEKAQPLLDKWLTATMIIIVLVVLAIWSIVGWMIYAFFLWLSCIMMSIVCTFRDAMRISMNASIVAILVSGFVALCALGLFYLSDSLGVLAVVGFAPPLILFFTIYYLKHTLKLVWLKAIGLMVLWSLLPTFLNSGIASLLYTLFAVVSGFSQL